ncbi:MAG: DUF5700 domain-containing putative Zn-dependent protease [Acidobacteriota bacterium]
MNATRLLPLALALAISSAKAQAGDASRLHVSMDAGEAEAVLAILRKEGTGSPVEDTDWKRLFETDGFRRLEAREAAMKVPFTREEFRGFVRSSALVARADDLASTLASWKQVDVDAAAARPLAYLPPGTEIRAKIFVVIKPRSNSFVFGQPDPAIFLALDPAVTRAKLSNTLSHELHHIGFATACPPGAAQAEREALAPPGQAAIKWLSAFGEGLAMLAAAGGPDVHPHAVSEPSERARWDADMKRADEDLRTLDAFFRDLLDGRLSGEKADERGFSFFGVQGPWYTVGYRMAVAIETAFGREELVRAFCDERLLLRTYNRAADELRRKGARWSSGLLAGLDRLRRAD